MAKFHLPKLNSWVTPLVLASIGLHGLVLALPMPDLGDPPVAVEELPEPEVIQVVTLPKLATASESPESPIPEPVQPEEPPPPAPPTEDIVLTDPEILDQTDPEILDQVEPEFDEPDDSGDESDADERDDGDGESEQELTLDQRIASRDSYQNFDGTKVGDIYVQNELLKLSQLPGGSWPTPLHTLAGELPALVVPLQDCLENKPGDSITIVVQIGPEAQLLGEPEAVNSTGYAVLDEKALEIAKAADYAPHHTPGKTKDYSFAIKVDYEACNVASNQFPSVRLGWG
ncbi:hypothetical protein IQ260_26435 [Leptolyngbya cf. ectocarpi LEGE 11479]|uniref:TonB C-terminal domain-containing protein n=1 Tax=Leptolyngbya cf. ectocarpi LEGE 11479 TaxID=1828722 RepID=A0A928ZZ55_LEPEC|nr:hypothetical protein [Leptolyngbya ectocarpi]MBE9070184.1 hypothetical protein [Leptolyngbya cf. ectocarpi LEGE 11479]